MKPAGESLRGMSPREGEEEGRDLRRERRDSFLKRSMP
jgi:hypothetical protein